MNELVQGADDRRSASHAAGSAALSAWRSPEHVHSEMEEADQICCLHRVV